MGRFVKFMQLDSGTPRATMSNPITAIMVSAMTLSPAKRPWPWSSLAEYLNDDLWISGLPAFWSYYSLVHRAG